MSDLKHSVLVRRAEGLLVIQDAIISTLRALTLALTEGLPGGPGVEWFQRSHPDLSRMATQTPRWHSGRMSEADARTFVVRVTRHEHVARGGAQFYAVMAESPREALEAVRKVVEASAYVEVTDGKLLPQTAGLLGLKPGVAKAM